MSWVRFDDGFPDHPKIAALDELEPLCAWLTVKATAWCNRNLTDGRIPKPQVRRLVTFLDRVKIDGKAVTADELAARLCRGVGDQSGLWEDRGDHYQIHDFLEYQPSRAEALDRREKKAAAGRIGGKRSGEQRRSEAEAQAKHRASSVLDVRLEDAEANTKQKATPVPGPVPVPDASSEASASASRARELRIPATPSNGQSPMAMRCPPDLEITAGMHEAFRAIGCLDPEAEARLYVVTYANGVRRDTDWTETGASFQSYLARHDQKGCAAGRRGPASGAPGKQERTLANMRRLAAGGEP